MIVEKYLETRWDVEFIITQNNGFNSCLRVPFIRTFNDEKLMNDYIKKLKEEIIPEDNKNGNYYSDIKIKGPYQHVCEKPLEIDDLIKKIERPELQEFINIIIRHISYEPHTNGKMGYLYFNGNKNAKRSHLIPNEEEIIKKFL